MTSLNPQQKFWIAIVVLGGYTVFGALCIFVPRPENSMIIVNTVLSTLGPLVGFAIKAVLDASHPTGLPDDPVHTQQEEPLGSQSINGDRG